MREQLIRYLLGELDAEEHEAVHAQLQASSELRNELARLRACFAAHQNDDVTAAALPSDLARRTTERISGYGNQAESPAEKNFAHTAEPPASILGWSLADLTVAGGVMLAVSMLIFPALRNSRDGTRRVVCQNNQRQMWVHLASYAQDHGGLYPQVGPNEPTGMYVARLIVKGYASPEELAVLLVCPGSPLADKIRKGQMQFCLPDGETMRSISSGQLAHLASVMSPFYAYRYPYRSGPYYYYIRDERQALSPVFGDTSSGDGADSMSPNHGGGIIQVQCQDGNLKSFTTSILPGVNDDLFRNDLGMVAAGLHRHDVVLGRSDASPGFTFAAHNR